MPERPVANGGRSPVPLLILTVFLDLVGFGIVVPQLPLAAARFEERGTILGLLVATDSLLSFFLAPQWGRLSDRIGRRPVLLVGLVASAVSYLLFALAPSLAILFVSRIVSGGFGATVNVSQAFLADVTPPERRSQAMGLIGAAFGLAFIVGPLVGGLVAPLGSAAPGLAAAATCGANLLLALVLLPESHARRDGTWDRGGTVPPRAGLVVLLATFAFTTVYVVFQRYADERLGLSRSAISYCFVLLGLVTALVQGRWVGRLVPVVGERRLIAWGGAALAAGLVLVAVAERAPVAARVAVLALGVVALSAGFSLVGPCTAGALSRMTSGEAQGRALGALQALGAGSRIAGPPLLGFASEAGGYGVAFGLAAVAAAGAAIVGWGWREASAGR
ncbi:MAG: MFS transporter [Gemmatimonadales bacterium]|jgi:multidrug resistance protein|nr:MFS transporter [Gemmatimonadales bacterium]